MSPLSTPVLAGAALVSAPALWRSLVEGSSPASAGLEWYLAGVALCWVGLSCVAELVGPPRRAEKVPVPDTDDEKVTT